MEKVFKIGLLVLGIGFLFVCFLFAQNGRYKVCTFNRVVYTLDSWKGVSEKVLEIPLTLYEFRDKYPMYDNMSNDELMIAIHNTFYKDMPFEEFKSKFYPLPFGDK